MLAFFSGHNPGLVSMVKATMKRWWKWVLGGAAGGLAAAALVAGSVAWRLNHLPAEQVQDLARTLAAEHEAMWVSVWGALPARDQGVGAHDALGWSLWPRPQIHLHGVRWAVPPELSSDGELRIERLSLGLEWRSLWLDTPRLHELRAQGVTGASRLPQWGLQGDWQVHQVSLGPADVAGARALAWSLDASLRPLRDLDGGTDPRPAWLAGQWQGRADWVPATSDEPAHWRHVDLRFKGQAAGQVVPSAQLTLARWSHQRDQQRLAWDDLVLQAQLGESNQASHIEWRVGALALGPDGASGQGMKGRWKTAAPLSLTWQMESAAPRGRYAAVTWPQWRLVPSGQDGTRAGGQLQADLGWVTDRRALRWDALRADVSVQPRGEAERQWSLRGQVELGLRGASWLLEGQALGGATDAVLWDGPFATDGEWQRWPQKDGQGQAGARLRVASLWPDRWAMASRSATWPALWSQLATWPGQLQIKVGQLGWRGLRLSGAEAVLDNHNGLVRLTALDARLWDGQLSAHGEWRWADDRWQLNARTRDADLALLRQTLDERAAGGAPAARQADGAAGRWSGSLALSGRGQDVREWQGSWSLDARAGHWPGVALRPARPPSEAGPASAGRTEWRRLQAQGSIAGGVAHMDRLQLSHPAWRMAADGSVDLQDGTLALTWSELVGNRKRGPVVTTSGPWRTPDTHTP